MDENCDDGVFCNGEEKCLNEECVNNENPCSSDQRCLENQRICQDVKKISATSVNHNLFKPVLLKKTCAQLVLNYDGNTDFSSSHSEITFKGPGDDSQGISLNPDKSIAKKRNNLFVPLCVERGAATGEWKITIETVSSDSSVLEQIESNFKVKSPLRNRRF
jgi:hypothetical protein